MDQASVSNPGGRQVRGRLRSPDRAELLAAIDRDGIEFLFAMFVDLHGKPCAKLVPASAVDQLLEDGAGFAGFAAGAMGQVPSSPDILAMPDLSSYTPAPWQSGLAILQCDPLLRRRALALRPPDHPASPDRAAP